MRRSKSRVSLGLPRTPSHRVPSRMQIFQWACLIGFILLGGCSATDSENTSPNPWNRPTKADVSRRDGWWFKETHDDGPANYHAPGEHFQGGTNEADWVPAGLGWGKADAGVV